jgi:hypothetical protein
MLDSNLLQEGRGQAVKLSTCKHVKAGIQASKLSAVKITCDNHLVKIKCSTCPEGGAENLMAAKIFPTFSSVRLSRLSHSARVFPQDDPDNPEFAHNSKLLNPRICSAAHVL